MAGAADGSLDRGLEAKAAKPDIIAPITRPACALLLFPEIRKQRMEAMGIVGPGSPGIYESGQIAQLREDLEYVMDNVPWPNFKNPKTAAVAEEYRKRRARQDLRHELVLLVRRHAFVIADILERAGRHARWTGDPDAVVDAIQKTN